MAGNEEWEIPKSDGEWQSCHETRTWSPRRLTGACSRFGEESFLGGTGGVEPSFQGRETERFKHPLPTAQAGVLGLDDGEDLLAIRVGQLFPHGAEFGVTSPGTFAVIPSALLRLTLRL